MRALIVIIAALLCSCSSHSNRYVIEGTTAKKGGYYYLLDGYNVIDSAEVVGGRYRFEGEIDPAMPVRNIASASNTNDFMNQIRFAQVILEGGTITVTEQDNSATGGLAIRGTKGNDAMYNFAREAMLIQEAIAESFYPENRKKLIEKYEQMLNKTIRKNLDNFASVNLLIASQNRYTVEQRLDIINRMSPQMRETRTVKALIEKLNTNNNE